MFIIESDFFKIHYEQPTWISHYYDWTVVDLVHQYRLNKYLIDQGVDPLSVSSLQATLVHRSKESLVENETMLWYEIPIVIYVYEEQQQFMETRITQKLVRQTRTRKACNLHLNHAEVFLKGMTAGSLLGLRVSRRPSSTYCSPWIIDAPTSPYQGQMTYVSSPLVRWSQVHLSPPKSFSPKIKQIIVTRQMSRASGHCRLTDLDSNGWNRFKSYREFARSRTDLNLDQRSVVTSEQLPVCQLSENGSTGTVESCPSA